jgi:glycosyltransferase involved in cell wall biosynthesis
MTSHFQVQDLGSSSPHLDQNALNDGGRLSVMVIDASCFSLPYDYGFCNALAENGCDVSLMRSKFLYGDFSLPCSFTVWNHFYNRSHASPASASRGPRWKLMKAGEHVAGMRKLTRRIATLKPDIVHFQWLQLPLLDRVYLSGIKQHSSLILTLHNPTGLHGSRFQQLCQAAGLRGILGQFDAVIVHSESSRQMALTRHHVAPEKLHVVPHGVLEHYRPDVVREDVAEAEMKVLFFGNIEPYKRLDILLRAFALLPASLRTRTELVVAGRPGCDLESFWQLAQVLGISSRVRWDLRYIPENEVGALFGSATVVALPYLSIDQSGVLMTAVGCRRPIVATRTGGIPETIQDGRHGLLVDPGDANALSEALKRVLSEPDLRRSMEKAQCGLLDGSLSWNAAAARTIEVYRQTIKSSADGGGGTVGRKRC